MLAKLAHHLRAPDVRKTFNDRRIDKISSCSKRKKPVGATNFVVRTYAHSIVAIGRSHRRVESQSKCHSSLSVTPRSTYDGKKSRGCTGKFSGRSTKHSKRKIKPIKSIFDVQAIKPVECLAFIGL